MPDYPRLRALFTCPLCLKAKPRQVLTCFACFAEMAASSVAEYADTMIRLREVERRLDLADLLTLADRTAREAQRETRRTHTVADQLAALAGCEAGSVSASVALSLIAFCGSVIAGMWLLGYPS